MSSSRASAMPATSPWQRRGTRSIAVGGSWGTLAEIGFARRLGRPVVVLEPGWEIEGVERAATPAAAVARVFELLGS